MNRNYVNRRQTAGRIFPTKLAQAVASALLFASGSPALFAMPTGGQVSAGQAQIGAPVNGTLTIEQTSSRAAINWQSFGITANEAVRFNQPSSSSIVLNRVLGVDPSNIYGSLSANGQVFLLEPNGVLFAPGAQVNVGGIVASTLQLADTDFMAGRYTFSKGTTAGSVINQGTITAANGGYVALLGPQVKNEGVISAALGTVALAAGNQITVNLNGNSLVSLTVDQGAVDALVQNKQLIKADGGQVIMTAKAADSLIRSVVNNEGIVEGNRIVVEGDRIRLAAGSRLDASADPAGSAPGGAILVGGGYRGQDAAIRNAQEVTVESGATLAADGAGSGSGGTVVVWSDGATRYSGDISARSGSAGGAGGLVEVSGKQALEFRGSVDTGGGTLLLDPATITVQAADGDQINTFGVGQINTLLGANNVTLDATGDITWNASTTLSYTNTVDRSLALQTGNSIIFNSGASITPGTNAAKLSVVLNADRDISGGGNIQLTSTMINSNGGAITLGGGTDPLTTAAIGIGTGSAQQKVGIYLSGSTLDAGAGAISLRGQGRAGTTQAHGIHLLSGSVVGSATGTGAITLTGTGGGGTSTNYGVYLAGSDTAVRSAEGAISITGQGGAGSSNYGVFLESGAAVNSTGTGPISLTATGVGSAADFGAGTAASSVTSTAGNITVNANSVDWGASLLTLQSGGNLIIQPRTASTSIGIGDSAIGILNLTAAELNGIQDGFASITIGKADGSGAVDVRSYSFKDDLLIRAPVGNNDITLNGALATGSGSQSGSITLQSGRRILANTGSSITTQGGDIILNADRDASGGGNIHLFGMTITSNGGDITLGGGADPLTTAAIGISAGNVSTTHGIYLGGATLDSASGAISLRGQGFAGIAGTAGIQLSNSVVESDTGTIALHGTGGAGTNSNFGVWFTNSNTVVRSAEGAITITGQGGAGAGGGNVGIQFQTGSRVESTGTGANAATVTLHGTGGAGTGGNPGIRLTGSNTGVSSVEGTILITGQGGAGGVSNYGIRLDSGAVVQSTGTGANGAALTLDGTGGAGIGDNHGVVLTGDTTAVRSVNGAILVLGQGGGGGTNSYGVRLESGAVVQSTGTGANAATVTLQGTGGAGTSANFGVSHTGSNTAVTSAEGDISITGQGGAGGIYSYGIHLDSGAQVQSTGSGANAARVTLQGTGGAGTDSNYGINLVGSDTRVSSAAGEIVVAAVAGAGTNALDFSNTTGSAAVSSASGRWLIYTSAPDSNTYGGLASGETALYGRTFAANPPATIAQSGNRYLFAAAPGTLTVTSSSASKIYGDVHELSSPVAGTHYALTGFADAAAYGGVWTQDTAANIGLGGAPVLTSAGTATTAGVGDYAINLALGTVTNSAGYTMAAGAANATLTVNRRPITVTANAGQSKVYGNGDPVFAYTVGGMGLANNETNATVFSGALARAGGENAGSNYAINQNTLAANANYDITAYTGANFSITQRPITVTADAGQNKVYGNADPALGYSVTSGNLVGADTLAGSIARATGENAGSYPIGQGTLANSNYAITYAGDNFAITRRPITVTADAGQNKIYGNADPALAWSLISGNLVGADTLGGSLGRAGGESVGSYAIDQGTLANSNYNLAFVSRDFAINKRPVTVMLGGGQAKIYGEPEPVLAYTHTSLGSGVPLAGALTRSGGESVGTYLMGPGTLTDASNPNYTLSYSGTHFDIMPRPLIVSADSQSRLEGQANPPLTANYSGFAFADGPASLNGALSLATAADQAARAGSYPITPSGQTSPNYAIAYVDGTLSVLFSSLDGAALDAIAAARKVEMLPLSPSGNSQQLVNIVGPGIALPEGVAP